MELKTDPIFFVGAMPPPLHGMSSVNAHMLDALRRQEQTIHLFDIARRPRRSAQSDIEPTNHESELVRLSRFVRTMAFASGRKKTYLSLSGGLGQVRDLVYLVLSRLFRAKIYLHHHSFAYINKRSFITLLCIRAAGPRADHIVLCDRMAALLCKQYQMRIEQVSCLSNAAFLSSSDIPPRRLRLKTVSFLSNITFEKGIGIFLEAANELHRRNVPVQFMIAGPAAPEVRAWLHDALGKAPYVRYLGPRYGDDKREFFNHTDLLVFPSSYVNEAEPVTILEAFSSGVPVIATALGCIAGLVGEQRGVALEAPTSIPLATAIADHIQYLAENDSEYQRLSGNCRSYLESTTEAGSSTLSRIIGAIRCGRDFGACP